MPIVMLSAAIDEWTQPLVGRVCDLNDWFADTIGAAIAVCVFLIVRASLVRTSRAHAGACDDQDRRCGTA